MPLVPPNVASLTPYVPGKPIEEVEREYGISNVAKLASNENALGPSPRAVAAAREACAKVHLYPDGSAFALRGALAARLGVTPEEVVLGHGSNEIIELLVRTFICPGEEVLTSAQSFVCYRLAAQAHGCPCVEAPMKDRAYDLDAIAARLSPRTKLIFLANPDNPTGTWFGAEALERFLARVPASVLVVLDEAYVEFASAPGFPDALALRRRHPNLVTLRTFSKVYGLAGLRVGYGVASPEVVGWLDRLRAPFNTSLVAQEAAIAALADEEHLARSRALVASERPFLEERLAALGGRVLPSQANFLFVDFPGHGAREVFEGLLRRGVVARPMAGYGFPTAQRITVGLHAENEKCLAALREVLAT
ncbi:histidinol-phosphate transaminase [Anaeromyxobacter paludicola]|uniref:Histidinol-phosphate aminotransferase n=1 Tax=Anaeromyxobacter paludicola TaxID=2918171 RepID=A0ABN6N3T6_9BACT|nr:histidinol-phosphate transaminase [Anaeromyxobacter paludicola]BDG07838.1 histidinol-phosphate aminotransferase [Anaeromyxobacter paludicola]